LRSEIKRLTKAARQSENWSDKVEKTKKGERVAGLRPDRGAIGHKAAKMMKRSKVLEKRQHMALEEKSKLLKNIDFAESLRLEPLAYHAHRLAGAQEVVGRWQSFRMCPSVTESGKCAAVYPLRSAAETESVCPGGTGAVNQVS